MRKLLAGLAVLVVLVVAAVIVVPLVVPLTAYQGRLIALVKQKTGRDLKIAGPIYFSVLPTPAVEADGVSLANAPGGNTPQMVELKQVRLRLELLPLLHGVVSVSRLVLVEPVIALEVDRAGRPNWWFGTAPAPSPAPARLTAEPAAAGGGLAISGLTLGKVRIVDGKISYRDQRNSRVYQLDGIYMTLSLHSLASPLAADGSAVWHGERVTFALNIDQPRALLDGGTSQVEIKLAAAPMALGFSGRVAGLPSARLAGMVDLKMRSLRQLAQWAGSPIAFSGGGLGPLAITGMVAIAGTKTSLGDANISLDAINAKGSIAVDNGGAWPMVTGKLDADKLDLNPYLSPEAVPTGRPAAANATASAPAPTGQIGRGDLIDASPLKFADADIDLKVDGIVYHQFHIGESTLGIHVKNGRLTADLSRMALYRGNGRGRLTVDGSGTAPILGLNVALAQVQIEPLAQAVIDDNRLTGTGNLDVSVTARGRSQRDLINTLSGSAALSLANGQIKGVNLPALAESAAKIERDIIRTLDVAEALNLLAHGQIDRVIPFTLVADAVKNLVGGGNTSNFATLTATGTITNGLVRNNDLQMRLGAVPLTGAGTVDLRTTVVNYRVSVQLAGGISVPIEVSGTWDNLNYRPDLAAMLVETPGNALAILKSAGGNVGQNVQGIGRDLKGVGQDAVGVFKGLFGK